jgi:hypothetical protein
VALALQVLVALAVIATALFDPNKPAVGIVCFVGIVLIETGVHARFASRLARIFRGHGAREYGVANCSWRRPGCSGRSGSCRCGRPRNGGRWWGGYCGRCRCRGGRCVGTAFRLAEVIPFRALESARGLCCFVFGAALLHCQCMSGRAAQSEPPSIAPAHMVAKRIIMAGLLAFCAYLRDKLQVRVLALDRSCDASRRGSPMSLRLSVHLHSDRSR